MAETKQNDLRSAVFTVHKIYIKDASFESPQTPGIFTQQVTPNVDVRMHIRHSVLDERQGYYEVVLTVTVTGTLEKTTVFLVEVHEAGIFQLAGLSAPEREAALEVACPNILLPFLRETVAYLVAQGGFPQLLINPINFEAVYREKQKRSQAGAPAAETGSATSAGAKPAAKTARKKPVRGSGKAPVRH